MATIKSYTSIEQSRKLAEILPLESADMAYWKKSYRPNDYAIMAHHTKELQEGFKAKGMEYTPCWSLTALLGVLPDTINGIEGYCRLTIDKEGDAYNISYDDILSEESIILFAEYSLIDGCYEMILKLHELKLL